MQLLRHPSKAIFAVRRSLNGQSDQKPHFHLSHCFGDANQTAALTFAPLQETKRRQYSTRDKLHYLDFFLTTEYSVQYYSVFQVDTHFSIIHARNQNAHASGSKTAYVYIKHSAYTPLYLQPSSHRCFESDSNHGKGTVDVELCPQQLPRR